MKYSINCKGKIINLAQPLVMGIINVTPDSFYYGHLNLGHDGIMALAEKMINDGADILDIGGQSTRPGSQPINVQEETDRVLPVIEKILVKFPGAIISIDTYFSEVARSAVAAGASIVNDISGGMQDSGMIPVVANLKVPFICMHMQGKPQTMQLDPHYSDVVKEVLDYFIERSTLCTNAGIQDIILDPGFGFGKTIEHNFSLLKNLSVFSMIDRPIMVGLSRKSTIYKTLGVPAAEALNGSSVAHTLALLNGASLLRVHDVKEAKEVVTLYNAYKNAP